MSDLTDTDRALGYTDLGEIATHEPDAMVAWDRDVAQRRRVREATSMRFRWRRGGRLLCYFRCEENWRISRKGNVARAPNEKLEWMPEIDTWVYTVEVLNLDGGVAAPDLRPYSLEYTEYPRDRISDHVKLTIAIDPGFATSAMSAMRATDRVPYTDEGWPLFSRSIAGAARERAERRARAAAFEASFKQVTP